MRVLKRAVWNVSKTYKKTFLMLLVMVVVMTLIFSGLALLISSRTATSNAQRSVNADVTLYPDYNKILQADRNGGLGDGVLLNDNLIEKLETSKYVKAVDYTYRAFAASKYHTSVTDEFSSMGRDPFTPEKDILPEGEIEFMIPTLYVMSLENVKKNTDFQSGKVKLKEGVYPKESKEQNPVIVSEKFLQRNNLGINQVIDITGGDTCTDGMKVTIVGVFEVLKEKEGSKSTNMQQMVEEDLNDFFYSDIKTTKAISTVGSTENRTNDQYENVNVELTSGKDLEAFLDEFNHDMGDTSYIKISAEQTTVAKTLSSIANVGEIANMIIIITTIAAIIILGLLILLSLRERKYEIGVLLSLGEDKALLIIQTVLESILVMVVAIMISILSSNVVANQMQSYMVSTNTEEVSNNPTSNNNFYVGSAEDTTQEDKPVKLDVNILNTNLLIQGIMIGISIIVVTSVLPMLITLKKDPKTLLLGRE